MSSELELGNLNLRFHHIHFYVDDIDEAKNYKATEAQFSSLVDGLETGLLDADVLEVGRKRWTSMMAYEEGTVRTCCYLFPPPPPPFPVPRAQRLKACIHHRSLPTTQLVRRLVRYFSRSSEVCARAGLPSSREHMPPRARSPHATS